jgi:hypothetical protein
VPKAMLPKTHAHDAHEEPAYSSSPPNQPGQHNPAVYAQPSPPASRPPSQRPSSARVRGRLANGHGQTAPRSNNNPANGDGGTNTATGLGPGHSIHCYDDHRTHNNSMYDPPKTSTSRSSSFGRRQGSSLTAHADAMKGRPRPEKNTGHVYHTAGYYVTDAHGDMRGQTDGQTDIRERRGLPLEMWMAAPEAADAGRIPAGGKPSMRTSQCLTPSCCSCFGHVFLCVWSSRCMCVCMSFCVCGQAVLCVCTYLSKCDVLDRTSLLGSFMMLMF